MFTLSATPPRSGVTLPLLPRSLYALHLASALEYVLFTSSAIALSAVLLTLFLPSFARILPCPMFVSHPLPSFCYTDPLTCRESVGRWGVRDVVAWRRWDWRALLDRGSPSFGTMMRFSYLILLCGVVSPVWVFLLRTSGDM